MNKKQIYIITGILVCVFCSVQCTKNDVQDSIVPTPNPGATKTLREQYSTNHANWPKANWYEGIIKREIAVLSPPPAPGSAKVLKLGHLLFFDPRLGGGTRTCASCHAPENYWIDRLAIASGGGVRNTPNIQDVWYLEGDLFHDGRAKTYAEQITEAIESPVEMNGDLNITPIVLAQISSYPALFSEAFGEEKITRERILTALEAFTKTIVSEETAFDRFVKGEHTALNDQQLEGLHLFRTKAGCINCHNGPMFTDKQYHNLGYSLDRLRNADYGRFNSTGINADRGKFRTPGLRNVQYTAPYLHNGTITTLDNLIDLLNEGMPQMNGQLVTGVLSPHIKPLGLNHSEKQAIIAFIHALSSAKPQIEHPTLP